MLNSAKSGQKINLRRKISSTRNRLRKKPGPGRGDIKPLKDTRNREKQMISAIYKQIRGRRSIKKETDPRIHCSTGKKKSLKKKTTKKTGEAPFVTKKGGPEKALGKGESI